MRTEQNCSPILTSSTIDGNISINCPTTSQGIARITDLLNSLRKDNRLSSNQLQAFIQTTNALLEKLLITDRRIDSHSVPAEAQINRVESLLKQQIAILRGSGNDASSVESSNQTGGVTAYSVGTVNESASSTNRSRFVKPLRSFYFRGVALRTALLQSNISDEDIEQIVSDAKKWLQTVDSWITKQMGPAAQARFTDTSGNLSYTYPTGASNKDATMRDNAVNSLDAYGRNLQILMQGDFDP